MAATDGAGGTSSAAIANARSAERSSIEIKDLLRKLHPERGSHKDRIRRLNKFRNYVMPVNGRTPEFFDDDIPLLFLGAATPSIFLDDDDDLPMGLYYGLLFACGMPSENSQGLKRSARHAINLVKWLLLDWREGSKSNDRNSIAMGGNNSQYDATTDPTLNVFAKSFLALPLHYYKHMKLEMHVTGSNDERGGSTEDACWIIVFIQMRHTTEDGERPSYILVEDLLTTPLAQQNYDLWSTRLSPQQTDVIKKNALARQAELTNRQRQDALANHGGTTPGGIGPGGGENEFDIVDESENNDDDDDNKAGDKKKGDDGADAKGKGDDKDDDSYYDPDENDVMAAIRRRQKQARKEAELLASGGTGSSKKGRDQAKAAAAMAVATRWEDSQVSREQAARAASIARAGQHDTVRDSQDAAAEAAEREEEKAKLIGKDPLGILNFEDYDLRTIEMKQAYYMEQALQEINEEIQKAESLGNEESIRKAVLQKESFEALVERMGGIEAMENSMAVTTPGGASAAGGGAGSSLTPGGTTPSASTFASSQQKASILPTNPKFDPILFLTLLHRKTPYNTLLASLDRLSRKTENQAEQLQNLVRDNFPLFVRCAEGFEEFRRSSEQEVGVGVNAGIEKLEAIAESSAYQAKKSFKPLLDNTSEVRKVQSALAVLNRVGPILQVPALMRQHIENRRYSQALKTYRRALVIDESCNIELLKLVKIQAEECVRDARIDLERRLTQEPSAASIDDLLNSIRDLGELIELEVSIPETTKTKKTEDANTTNNDKTKSSNPNTKKDPQQQGPAPVKEVGVPLTPKEQQQRGRYEIGNIVVKIREHPPALACLLLQAAHFTLATQSLVQNAEDTSQRIYAGETLTQVQNSVAAGNGSIDPSAGGAGIGGSTPAGSDGTTTPGNNNKTLTSNKPAGTGNQWKYDVLDARVISTTKAVDIARVWLPRLVRIGKAAREDEKRRAARIGSRRRSSVMGRAGSNEMLSSQLTAFEVFVGNVTPALTKLVEHAAFCALGSNTRTGAKYIEMTYGQNAEDKLRTLLRSPLPPSQSTKVGKELADLVELLSESSTATDDMRPNTILFKASPLESCQRLGDSAVVTIEKRRCIYAFDVCSRTCSNRASGSGKFDADALLQCLRDLSEQLSRPEECSNEVEKGCELVVRRCCEGLAGYVRDRGDDARLLAVAECADVISDRIDDVIREVTKLTNNFKHVHDVVMEDIVGLESAMFDEYLESIRQHVANSVKVGWLDSEHSMNASLSDGTATDIDGEAGASNNQPPAFPAYLSASLLAIARCRAQVEQSLGDRIRKNATLGAGHTVGGTNHPKGQSQSGHQHHGNHHHHHHQQHHHHHGQQQQHHDGNGNHHHHHSGGVPYQHLAMATVADGVIEGICNEIMKRKMRLKVRQADRLANELEFLSNTLNKFLTSDDTRALLKTTLQMVCTKAGRTTTSAGTGGPTSPETNLTSTGTNSNSNMNSSPDGLAAIEELERLGRVYVLCLGD